MTRPVPCRLEESERDRTGGAVRSKRAIGAAVGLTIALAAFPSAAQDETTSTTVPVEETTTTEAVPPTSAPEVPETTAAPTTPATPSTLSAAEKARKQEAAGELNAAKAADTEIASGLISLNESVQASQSKVDEAQRRLEEALETQRTAGEEIVRSAEEQARIEVQLRAKAVEGFKTGLSDPGLFFSNGNVNQAIRQTQLLQQTNKGTAELLEDLRILREDSEAAQAEAVQAAADAERLEQEQLADLATLQDQQNKQLRLKSEAESRISRWEAELSAYAAEDKAIQQLIADSTAADVVVSRPGVPSALGFQWPVEGRVTSNYGYRIHPVYGTRKLHSGMDIGAPSGTPITATSDGKAIFVGSRGGYGNTVILDHGNGITSLYGHMSSYGVSQGATVSRGDVIGGVGQTGTATGNHLHFEIRLDGSPTDPRPYLP